MKLATVIPNPIDINYLRKFGNNIKDTRDINFYSLDINIFNKTSIDQSKGLHESMPMLTRPQHYWDVSTPEELWNFVNSLSIPIKQKHKGYSLQSYDRPCAIYEYWETGSAHVDSADISSGSVIIPLYGTTRTEFFIENKPVESIEYGPGQIGIFNTDVLHKVNLLDEYRLMIQIFIEPNIDWSNEDEIKL